MRVSIITPLYNQEEYIAETIESALAQTYKDVEIIVVNDASTDGSLAVAQKYADRVKIVSNPVNRGLPATRNIAISHATGDLILPLDSDDKIDPQYLEKTVALMTDGVGVVATWMWVEPVADMLSKGHSRAALGAPGSGWPIYAPTKQQILHGNSIPVCSLIRRKALEETGGYDETFYDGAEDWGLWCGIVSLGTWSIRVLPEYLFHYRVHAKSMCRSVNMCSITARREQLRKKYE